MQQAVFQTMGKGAHKITFIVDGKVYKIEKWTSKKYAFDRFHNLTKSWNPELKSSFQNFNPFSREWEWQDEIN